MPKRLPIAELAHREYWTVSEAALVLGRSRGFWQERFDAGEVAGYLGEETDRRANGRTRYLQAASCRAYLESQCVVHAGEASAHQLMMGRPAQSARAGLDAFRRAMEQREEEKQWASG